MIKIIATFLKNISTMIKKIIRPFVQFQFNNEERQITLRVPLMVYVKQPEVGPLWLGEMKDETTTT